jgi:cation diffusion facilitator CzcD-associated flavoprotein CzcO/NAD(P)-dependent dehydrogenase (short-subunit alcohol dehydrogenase family)
VEHLDVVIVGAGLSGVGAAHHLQTKCPWADFAILEARDSIGGTWDLFRYPGVRSDSDMYTLGYSFRPWPGEKTIAEGGAILDYVRTVAAEDGTDAKIRFNRKVVAAAWSSEDARWTITVEVADTGETEQLTAHFLFSCSGYYRYDHGYLPDFPGVDDFGGTFIHPQFWPDDLDYAGKSIVVIGSGATAITLIPALAKTAGHVTMLQRSPTYIVSLSATSALADTLRRLLPGDLGATATRWALALGTQGLYRFSKMRPERVRKALLDGVAAQLPEGYPVDEHFSPRYDPWDQRLCVVPDGDLFAAISSGRADVVTDTIDTFTEHGVRTTSGTELRADIVVSATGLDLVFMGGVALTVDGEPVDIAERFVYKGMMLAGVPNAAAAIGYTNASWTLKCELTCDYVTRLLNHLRATGLRQCTPVPDSPDMDEQPLLGLTSGYITRSADRFPKSGTAYPWRVDQSYLKDYRATRGRSIDDGVMRFSNPDPDAVRPIVNQSARTAPHNRFDGRVAAITGAGSGIGRALAVELARRGAHLALSDVDVDGMAETVTLCEGHGVKVTSAEVDVADRAAVEAWAGRVVADHSQVNFIFNNAGVALGATVESESYDDFEWLMNIDFWGVVYGTKAFLPHLKASGEGHIVNLSSVFGLVSIPSQSAYNAAKFAVRGFTDSLRMELEIEGAPVSSTTVHPGGVKTNIARRARVDESVGAMSGGGSIGDSFDRIAMTSPAKAAKQILDGVAANKRRVLVGPDAKLIDFVARLPAAVYQNVLIRGARRNARQNAG